MLYRISLFLGVIILSSQALATTIQNFTCPVVDTNPSIEKMYEAMAVDSNWAFYLRDPQALRFVDETSLGSQDFLQHYEHFNGIFKVNYNFNPECRRQVLIEEPHATEAGVFKGWLAVEICDPKIRNIPVEYLTDIARARNEVTNPALLTAIEKINKDGLLELKDHHEGYVKYQEIDVENDDGTKSKKLIHRFMVKLDRIYFEENSAGLCHFKTETAFNVRAGTTYGSNRHGYAKIARYYQWSYDKANPTDILGLAYFDDQGEQVYVQYPKGQ